MLKISVSKVVKYFCKFEQIDEFAVRSEFDDYLSYNFSVLHLSFLDEVAIVRAAHFQEDLGILESLLWHRS